MYCSVILTAKEFKDIHNALWKLGQDPTRKVVEKQVEIIRAALAGAYEQERADFNKKSKYYESIRKSSKFNSIWSIYDVANLAEVASVQGEVLRYAGYEVPLRENSTWVDLWTAAEEIIKKSKDDHHIFIEEFYPSKEDGRPVLSLQTGS